MSAMSRAAVTAALDRLTQPDVFELGGPRVYTYREIDDSDAAAKSTAKSRSWAFPPAS